MPRKECCPESVEAQRRLLERNVAQRGLRHKEDCCPERIHAQRGVMPAEEFA